MSVLISKIRWVLAGKDGVSAVLQTLASRILVLVLNVGTGVLTARSLGPDGRGELAAVILWPSFLPYLMTLGLPLALLYTIKKNPKEESQIYAAALLLGTCFGCISTIIGVFLMPFLLQKYSSELVNLSQLLMLTAPMVLLGLVFLMPLQARGEFHKMNQLSYLPPILTALSLYVLKLTNFLSVSTAVFSYTIPSLLVFFGLLRYMLFRFQPQFKEIKRNCKRLLGYGIRFYGIDLLNSVSGQISQLIVVGLLTPADMGLYVISMGTSRMLNLLQNSVATILMSKAAARPVEEVVTMTGQSVRASTAITALAAICLIISSQFFLDLLYGIDFVEAVNVLRLLLIEAVVSGTIVILIQAFTALGKPEVVNASQILGLAISIPMMMWLIPLYGLVGSGLALLCSTSIRMIFVLVSYPLVLKVRPPNLIFTKNDFIMLGIWKS